MNQSNPKKQIEGDAVDLQQDLKEKIRNLKKQLGDKVYIPTHHFQSQDIVDVGDTASDSYELAVACTKTNASFIIFCGVSFMAEGAKLTAKNGQRVLTPDPNAGCPLVHEADTKLVQDAYKIISKECKYEVIPIAYINSSPESKSFCGERGGAVCTSNNASKVLDYYLKQNKSVFFFPDWYTGINTTRSLNIDNQFIVKIKKDLSLESSGVISNAKVFLWHRCCPTHQMLTLDDMNELRKKYPDIKVIVHPECKEELIENADMVGSSEGIFTTLRDAPPGSTWGVGTGSDYAERLALNFPDKHILPLRDSKCPHMRKITLSKLANSLESIVYFLDSRGELNYEMNVDEKHKPYAKIAFERMMEIGPLTGL